jgi:hypothetical protein
MVYNTTVNWRTREHLLLKKPLKLAFSILSSLLLLNSVWRENCSSPYIVTTCVQEQLENLTQLKQTMEMEKMKLLLDLQVIK